MLSAMANASFAPSGRWYDEDPHAGPTIGLLLEFPKEVLAIIAEGMVDFALCKFNMEDRLKDSRQLGVTRVLALYQAQKKRREPDACSHTHRIINYLMVLDGEGRRLMVTHVLELVQHVRHYYEACSEYQQALDLKDVGVITQTYVKTGSQAAHLFLQTIRKQFVENVQSTQQALKLAQEQEKSGDKTHAKVDRLRRDMKIQDDLPTRGIPSN